MKTIDELLNQITPEEQAKCDADMIEQIERKAFQAGWEGAVDTYEVWGIRGFRDWDFNKWKEESK